MKKTIFAVMLLIGVTAAQVNAQSTSFGLKAEANLSNFIVTDAPGVNSNMGFGATLGAFVKFDLSDHFALQPELLFHYQSSETEVSILDNDFEYWGGEIPVYFMGQWNTGTNGRFYVGVGPYFGLGFSAKYTNGDINLYDTNALKQFDFGAKATVGYEFGNGLQINAGYKIGFLDMVDTGIGKLHPEMISLGLGFRF